MGIEDNFSTQNNEGAENKLRKVREALQDLFTNPEKLKNFKNPDGSMAPGLKSSLLDWEGILSESQLSEDKRLLKGIQDLMEKTFTEQISVETLQQSDFNGGTPRRQDESFLNFPKARAIKYVEAGDLKTAIDSMISDLKKTDMITEDQKTMATMMGMALKNDPNISEDSVRDFINGF